MDHKAFVFDHARFSHELAGLLASSLESGSVAGLRRFVGDQLSDLKDPYEGQPLAADWESLLETRDAHQYGDFALTKYYDPADDLGLGRDWERIRSMLTKPLNGDVRLFLGVPFGPKNNLFDPGKLGSYFQSPQMARQHLAQLHPLRSIPGLGEVLPEVLRIFEQAALQDRGLYITF